MQQQYAKSLIILGALLGLGLLNTVVPTQAYAASRFQDALITVGLGTATGTVLGASTLPFYGYPENHLGNVLIGAGIGLVTGLGTALYFMTTPEYEPRQRPVSGTDSLEGFSHTRGTASAALPASDRRPTNQRASALSLNLVALSF